MLTPLGCRVYRDAVGRKCWWRNKLLSCSRTRRVPRSRFGFPLGFPRFWHGRPGQCVKSATSKLTLRSEPRQIPQENSNEGVPSPTWSVPEDRVGIGGCERITCKSTQFPPLQRFASRVYCGFPVTPKVPAGVSGGSSRPAGIIPVPCPCKTQVNAYQCGLACG